MKMHSNLKRRVFMSRALAVLLCFLMVLATLLPSGVLAEEPTSEGSQIEEIVDELTDGSDNESLEGTTETGDILEDDTNVEVDNVEPIVEEIVEDIPVEEPVVEEPVQEIRYGTSFSYVEKDNEGSVVFSVDVTCAENAQIPETAVLYADKLNEGSDKYWSAYNAVADAVSLDEDAILRYVPYDIYFVDNDVRIEPELGPIHVTMAFRDAPIPSADETEDVLSKFVAHVDVDGNVETLQNKADSNTVFQFDVDSFSPMGAAEIRKAVVVDVSDETEVADSADVVESVDDVDDTTDGDVIVVDKPQEQSTEPQTEEPKRGVGTVPVSDVPDVQPQEPVTEDSNDKDEVIEETEPEGAKSPAKKAPEEEVKEEPVSTFVEDMSYLYVDETIQVRADVTKAEMPKGVRLMFVREDVDNLETVKLAIASAMKAEEGFTVELIPYKAYFTDNDGEYMPTNTGSKLSVAFKEDPFADGNEDYIFVQVVDGKAVIYENESEGDGEADVSYVFSLENYGEVYLARLIKSAEKEPTRGGDTKSASDDFIVDMVYMRSDASDPQHKYGSDTPYEFVAETSLNGTVTLQVNIIGHELSKDYAPGELEIKVYGLEKFGLTNVNIQSTVFSYEHVTGTFNEETRTVDEDYYIFRNNAQLNEGTNMEALFQLVYRYNNVASGCPFNESEGDVYAVFDGQDTGHIQCSFDLSEYEYSIYGRSQSQVRHLDGLGDDAADYYWSYLYHESLKYTAAILPVYSSTKQPDYNLTFVVSGLPEGCSVIGIDYNSNRALVYDWDPELQAYVYAPRVENNAVRTADVAQNLYIGVPRDSTELGDRYDVTLSAYGHYLYKLGYNPAYANEEQELLAAITRPITIRDDIEDSDEGFAFSTYIADRYRSGNATTSTSFSVGVPFSGYSNCDEEHRLLFWLRGLFIEDYDGNVYPVTDDEYHFNRIDLPRLQDRNKLAKAVTWDVYVRYRGEDEFVLWREDMAPSVIWASSDEAIVEAYIVSSPITGYCYYNGSSAGIQAYHVFDVRPEQYIANNYVGMFGSMEILEADSDTRISAPDLSDYKEEAQLVGFPEADLAEFGHYVATGVKLAQIKPDSYHGNIGLRDYLIADSSGYSDYNLFFQSTFFGQDTSVEEINGYDAYMVLPEQVTLIGNASDIKAQMLSSALKSYYSSSFSSFVNNYVTSPEISSVDEYIQFLYDSLTVDVRHVDGKTIVGFHYAFAEPLKSTKQSSQLNNPFGGMISVRIYDTDIITYGSTLTVEAYVAPRLRDGDLFTEGVVYSSGGNWNPIMLSPSDKIGDGRMFTDTIDVDGDGDVVEQFYDYTSTVVYGKAIESMQEFSKLSKTDGAMNMKPKTVNSGETYTYRLRVRSAVTGLKNLVIYDRLDNHLPDGVTEFWSGTFESVDTSVVTHSGYAPTVYYSSNPDAGKFGEDNSWQVYSESVDKSSVKALAFDWGDQVIPDGSVVYVDVTMRAPEGESDYYAYNRYDVELYRVNMTNGEVYPEKVEYYSNVTVTALNNYVDETKQIVVSKVWDDDNDQRHLRPTSIVVHVFQDGNPLQDVTLTADGGWSKTIPSLPWFDETGHEFIYTVTEEPVERYEVDIEGTTITNHVLRTVDIPIEKHDGNTDVILAGCTLQVLDSTGAVLDEWVSTEEAHTVEGLERMVTYKLHEVSAPDGYATTIDIEFSIDADGNIVKDGAILETLVIRDYPKVTLPSTGSLTSLWVMLAGLMIVGAGFVLMNVRRRKVHTR